VCTIPQREQAMMNKCGTVESMDRKEKEKQGTILLKKA
jgi:hypothetical protein